MRQTRAIGFSPAIGRIAKAWRRQRALRRLRSELRRHTQGELSGLLVRAGLRRADLFAAFKGNARHRQLMGHMMARFGIDRERAIAHCWGNLLHAEAVCLQCPNRGRCRRWLAWGAANNAPNAFCPNAGLFAQLRLGLARLTREQARTYGSGDVPPARVGSA